MSRIHNLHDQIGALDDSPQLPPDLEIALEGCHEQVVVLLQLGEAPPPLQQRRPLLLIQFLWSRVGVPLWPTRNSQSLPILLVLLRDVALLYGGQQVRVLLIAVYDLDVVHFLRGEVGASQFCGGEEVVEGALLGDGAHLDP
jgi:hypothetical protein